MIVDPIASLRCWEVVVDLGGQEYTIPALPAADWWAVMLDGRDQSVLDLIPGDDLDDRIQAGEVTMRDLTTGVRDAVEQIAGRSMHATAVLVHTAAASWPYFSGKLARSGFRWDVMPFAAALDAVFLVAIEALNGAVSNASEKDAKAAEQRRALFLAELEKGDPVEQRESVKAAMEGFGEKPTGGVIRSTATGEQSGGIRPRTRIRPGYRPRNAPSGSPTPPPAAP